VSREVNLSQSAPSQQRRRYLQVCKASRENKKGGLSALYRATPGVHRVARLRRKIGADPRPFTPLPTPAALLRMHEIDTKLLGLCHQATSDRDDSRHNIGHDKISAVDGMALRERESEQLTHALPPSTTAAPTGGRHVERPQCRRVKPPQFS
jgi:hypothetical protein